MSDERDNSQEQQPAVKPQQPSSGEQAEREPAPDLASAWEASEAAADAEHAAGATEAQPAIPERERAAAGPAAETEAPAEGGDIDPELLRMPRPRTGRHPLVSTLVIGLAIFLMAFLWRDFSYFFVGDHPRDLGPVSTAVREGKLQPNTYVTLHGAPDRKHALLLEGRVSGYDSFFRLRQAGGKVYVQRHRTERSTNRTVSGVHTGRLVRFDRLSYAEQVRKYYKKTVNVAHEFDMARLRQLQKSGARRGRDRDGLAVSLPPDKLFWINVTFPGEWLIQFSKKAYPSAEAAAKQLSGLRLPYVRDSEPSPSFWRFIVVANDDESKQLMKLFRDPELYAGVLRRQVSYAVRYKQLQVKGNDLLIRGKDDSFPARYRIEQSDSKRRLVADDTSPIRVPGKAVRYISTSSKFVVPDDAMVLVAGVEPGDHWFYPLLYLVLLGFIGLNIFALVTRFRRS